jgi:DNA ligase (NAD+)
MAESTVDYLSQAQTKKLIEELKTAGVNFKEDFSAVKTGVLGGKTVVFSGELRGFSRSQAQELVRQRGGNPSSSISNNTDLLVAGDNPGSKYDKAQKLGVKIIDEKEFSGLLEAK